MKSFRMMCKIVYALLFVATIEARFLGGHGNYQLTTAIIPFGWVLQENHDQVDFVYPTQVEAVGNAVANWVYVIPENGMQQTSHITSSQMDAPSFELLIAPVINLVRPAPVDSVSHSDVVKNGITAGRVRLKRKSFLRYGNGEFRPTLCSPRLCLSDRPFGE